MPHGYLLEIIQCGHCQRLAPEWAALATTMKGEVKIAKVDATVSK